MAPKRDASPSSLTHKSDNYIHVHLYQAGRWGAWVSQRPCQMCARELKVGGQRRFLGTHLTERLAARCQDRALLKMEMERGLKGKEKLNFDREDYKEDEHMSWTMISVTVRRQRNTLPTDEFLKYLRGESRERYRKYTPTPCLLKFMAEEEASGNLKPEETRSAIRAPESTSKGTRKFFKPTVPKTTNLKPKNKKQTLKDCYSSDEEFNHYPSESEGEGEDEDKELMDEDLETPTNLAIVAYVDKPEQFASVAPVNPSLTGTRKRQSTLFREDKEETLMKNEALTKDGALTKDEALTTDEEEVLEALLILAAGPPKMKSSRH